jgi:hypothetical protein
LAYSIFLTLQAVSKQFVGFIILGDQFFDLTLLVGKFAAAGAVSA